MAKELNPKDLKKLLELQERMTKSGVDWSNSMKSSKGFVDSISNQLFGMGSSKFFEEVKFSAEDLSKMSEDVKVLDDALQDASATVNKDFKTALANARRESTKMGVDFNANLNTMLDNLSSTMPEIAKEIADAISSKTFSGMSEEAMKEFRKITKDKEGFNRLEKFFDSKAVKNIKEIEKELGKTNEMLQSNGQTTLKWDKTLNTIAERLTRGFNLNSLRDSVLSYDQTLTDAQKDTGIAFKNNSMGMADLTSYTQQFGLGVKEAGELMGNLGGVLRTTDFNILSEAAKDMAAIGKSTGLSANEVGDLGGQMMLLGKSSKDVSQFAENTMKSAMNFGVNGRKVMQDIVKNLPKFRQMGFQGGEESLKRMAIQAERLGQNIDEIFDMSKRARNIEGALDMASQLQLAGGSFANINPMDLLSAARKGPEELQKILGQMGKDIGKFDKATGQMAFDAVDFDRLQMVADATGMSVDSLQKQITKMNQDASKTELIPPGLFDSLSEEQKAFLLNSVGKDGKLSMSIDGVDDVGKLTTGNIQMELERQAKEKGNLEEQAKQNTSFQESIKNLKDSIMNIFVVFEPVIKALTRFIQWLNAAFSSFGVIGKTVFAVALGGLALLFSAGKQFANGVSFGKGFQSAAGMGGQGGGITSMFKKGGGGGGIPSPSGADAIPDKGKPGGFLESLASGLKAFGKDMAQIIKGAVALSLSALLIGGALVAITAGIAAFGGDATGGQLVTFGLALVGLAGTMFLMSKIMGQVSPADILKGSFAMVVMGAALVPFAFAMQMMSGIPWTQMLASLGIAALAVLALAGIGAIMMTPAGIAFLFGAGALAIAGLSLMVFGASLLVAASGFKAMTEINWDSFSSMGSALLSILPGLLGLAGIGLFAIPSLLLMSFALGSLAAVMSILAPAMSVASMATHSMASGITELKEAIKGLDTSKLESMADAAERLSVGTAIGGLANAISGFAGGKSEKETTVRIAPIEIELKLDGRTLQKLIIDDTKIIS